MMEPNPSFLNPDDFPEPHMEAVKVSEAERLAREIDGARYGDVAVELRRLAAFKRDRDELVSRFHCLMADFGLHPGRTDDDLLVILRREIEAWRYGLHHLRDNNVALRADRDRLAAEVEALRAALGFYADESRYFGPNQRLDGRDEWSERAGLEVYRLDVTRDRGAIARDALEPEFGAAVAAAIDAAKASAAER